MATNAKNPTQATIKTATAMVREEDLEALENLLKELQTRVEEARDDGRVYLMSQYVRLVALVSPEIDRIHRRFKRDNLAYMRKTHKMLKLEQKAAAEEEEENGA